VQLTLAHRGHRVIEAEDGTVGLRLMRAEHPDLVVMDVTMPGPSGLDVLREMRADLAARVEPPPTWTSRSVRRHCSPW
jgi:DNA-binding response OmpR family regulator